jgi:hypothetical protein
MLVQSFVAMKKKLILLPVTKSTNETWYNGCTIILVSA